MFSNLPQYQVLNYQECFLVSKSEHFSTSEYRSLAIQRLRMLTSTFERAQKQIYYLPSKNLLIMLWRDILQCFHDQIKSGRTTFNYADFDIIDLIQFLKECIWIFIEIPNIRGELYFGFELELEQSQYYNSRDEAKNFHIYPGDETFICTFLLSHVLRNMEFTMARYLIDYYANLFFEEYLFNIHNNLENLSLITYQKKYESENHLMKYINEYIENLNDLDNIEILNNITCISKLIGMTLNSLNY